jgi:hypothetical protein
MSTRRSQLRHRALAAGLAVLSLLPLSAQVPMAGTSGEVPPPIPAWAKEVESFKGSPRPIAYLVSQRSFQTGACLIEGIRPREDRPSTGKPVFGGPLEPGDWLLEDPSGAIRVSGAKPPPPGRRVLLAATFADAALPPSLQGLRWMASGLGDGTDVLQVGEYLHLSMHVSKSTSQFPEFAGDTRAMEVLFFHEGVILKGLAPGTVSIKIFEQWWNRSAPEFVREFKLKVLGP